jgi:hypothetical protein
MASLRPNDVRKWTAQVISPDAADLPKIPVAEVGRLPFEILAG